MLEQHSKAQGDDPAVILEAVRRESFVKKWGGLFGVLFVLMIMASPILACCGIWSLADSYSQQEVSAGMVIAWSSGIAGTLGVLGLAVLMVVSVWLSPRANTALRVVSTVCAITAIVGAALFFFLPFSLGDVWLNIWLDFSIGLARPVLFAITVIGMMVVFFCWIASRVKRERDESGEEETGDHA